MLFSKTNGFQLIYSDILCRYHSDSQAFSSDAQPTAQSDEHNFVLLPVAVAEEAATCLYDLPLPVHPSPLT